MKLVWKRVVVFFIVLLILALDLLTDDVGQGRLPSSAVLRLLLGLVWYGLCYSSGLYLPVLLTRRSIHLATAFGIWVILTASLVAVMVTLVRHSDIVSVFGPGTFAAIIGTGLDTFIRHKVHKKQVE